MHGVFNAKGMSSRVIGLVKGRVAKQGTNMCEDF